MRIVMLLLAGLCLLASPVMAQDAAQNAGPDARRLELADQYLGLTTGPTVRKFLSSYYEEVLAKVEMPDEQRAWWVQHMPTALEEVMEATYADLRDDVAEIFTERELEALIAFYSSPEGRSIAEKSMDLAIREQEAMTPHMLEMVTDMRTKFCTRFDCEAEFGELTGKSGY